MEFSYFQGTAILTGIEALKKSDLRMPCIFIFIKALVSLLSMSSSIPLFTKLELIPELNIPPPFACTFLGAFFTRFCFNSPNGFTAAGELTKFLCWLWLKFGLLLALLLLLIMFMWAWYCDVRLLMLCELFAEELDDAIIVEVKNSFCSSFSIIYQKKEYF